MDINSYMWGTDFDDVIKSYTKFNNGIKIISNRTILRVYKISILVLTTNKYKITHTNIHNMYYNYFIESNNQIGIHFCRDLRLDFFYAERW